MIIMTFKLSNYCPATVDTIVCYIQYDGPVSFSDTSVLKAFKLTLVENQFDFAKGDVKSYLIKWKISL